MIIYSFIIAFFLMSNFFVTGENITFEKQADKINLNQNYQDGRYTKKLEWHSPNNELPGTYQEYLQKHPLTSAEFSQPLKNRIISKQNNTIAILVDNDLYKNIKTNLEQYIYDLQIEGYDTFFETVTGGTPLEIKQWIQTQYNKGCIGVVFIGDITAAWAEVSGSVFPSDLYYMDVDGNWTDTNDDGIFDVHDQGYGDMGPEIYVGRIYAHTLNYDTEANMVNDYLEKVHRYRVGELTQPWQGLEYIEEDWYDMDVFLNNVYTENIDHFDYGYFTTGQDYLNQMENGYHFVQVCAHSYPGGHHFSTRPTESASYAHLYVYSPTARPAKLLLGSDDGIKVWLNGEVVLTKDRYGNWIKDRYSADVNLSEGWNRLMCKISQRGNDYKFSARVTDESEETFDDLIYQINNPELYNGDAEFIRSWLLNGFHQDLSENFWNYLITNYLGQNEEDINPSEGQIMGGQTWIKYESGNPYIDMSEHCDKADFGVCYAFTRVYSPDDLSCQLRMGYDDGARVWLNGEEILNDSRSGGFEADMQQINITLNSGENRLLVKISEWMGEHGFGVKICHANGTSVEGLTYDPEPTPITHVGTWLINGPYVNPDRDTRLTENYLVDEKNITPSKGDAAPFGSWECGIGNGCPFNLGTYFDHGDWVFSDDVQLRDPPVLFYNLFACGPGRFTDDNYLAGAYIFHTTYGLITVASAKSGSMLNFQHFTKPLGEGKSIGESFRIWFDIQAPYGSWEKEWYYGMVVCGDPTLEVIPRTAVKITKPENGIYLAGNKVFPFFTKIVIGDIDVTLDFVDQVGIDKVEFYLDDELIETDDNPPYSWSWIEQTPMKLRHSVSAKAYNILGNYTTDNIIVWRFL